MMLSLKRKSTRSFKTLSILSLFNPSLQFINGFIGVSLPLLSSFDHLGCQNLRKNKESCLRDASKSIFSKFDEPDFDGGTPTSIGSKSSSQSSSVSEDEEDDNYTSADRQKVFEKGAKALYVAYMMTT